MIALHIERICTELLQQKLNTSSDDLKVAWNFSRQIQQSIENAKRLENMTWRLWNKKSSAFDRKEQNSELNEKFSKVSVSQKEKDIKEAMESSVRAENTVKSTESSISSHSQSSNKEKKWTKKISNFVPDSDMDHSSVSSIEETFEEATEGQIFDHTLKIETIDCRKEQRASRKSILSSLLEVTKPAYAKPPEESQPQEQKSENLSRKNSISESAFSDNQAPFFIW